MTILCVDDDPEDLEMFREVVQSIRPGANCLLAQDATNALRFLHDATILPDLLFLDINMPGMNGIQFLKHLQTIPEYKNIPVVMYSTSLNHTDYHESIRHGAIGFIQKANTLKDMYNSLRVYIQQ